MFLDIWHVGEKQQASGHEVPLGWVSKGRNGKSKFRAGKCQRISNLKISTCVERMDTMLNNGRLGQNEQEAGRFSTSQEEDYY